MVRWVVFCAMASGLACSVPNELFKVQEGESTEGPLDPSASTTSALDPPGTAASGSAEADTGGTTTDMTTEAGDAPLTTGDETTTNPAITSAGESASSDATTGDETTGDASTTATTTGDGSAGEPVCAGECGAPGCGECPDIATIAFPGFSIDSREVNNGQYAQFLAAAPDPALQAPACAWNDDFTPAQWPVPNGDALPVVNVDWCDAHAYCAWSGKRLCGAIDGGPADFSDIVDPDVNQWYHACSNGQGLPYPYGSLYVPIACNGADLGFGAVLPVGLLALCQAPRPGLFDLSGNVWEWVDSCASDGPDADCLRRGGSFLSKPKDLRCDLKSSRKRSDAGEHVGIRCCSE